MEIPISKTCRGKAGMASTSKAIKREGYLEGAAQIYRSTARWSGRLDREPALLPPLTSTFVVELSSRNFLSTQDIIHFWGDYKPPPFYFGWTFSLYDLNISSNCEHKHLATYLGKKISI
jgi:hypothetical protein